MVLISLNIDEKVKNQVKLLGITHAGVYARGVKVLLENPYEQYQESLAQWEKKTARLSNLLDLYIRKSIELEDKIKKMEAEANVRNKKKSK